MCADVQVIEREVEECVGKCQGGGVCMNGECRCRKGYSGAFCQYKDNEGTSLGTVFFYFAVFLFVIVLIAALFYGAVRIIRYIDEQRLRIAEQDREFAASQQRFPDDKITD